jgi:hypothetical protein
VLDFIVGILARRSPFKIAGVVAELVPVQVTTLRPFRLRSFPAQENQLVNELRMAPRKAAKTDLQIPVRVRSRRHLMGELPLYKREYSTICRRAVVNTTRYFPNSNHFLSSERAAVNGSSGCERTSFPK